MCVHCARTRFADGRAWAIVFARRDSFFRNARRFGKEPSPLTRHGTMNSRVSSHTCHIYYAIAISHLKLTTSSISSAGKEARTRLRARCSLS